MARHALVAGATGALGSKVAAELKARGWHVRGLTRSRAKASGLDDVHEGDGLEPRSLAGAADGCDVVFSAVGASVMPSLGAGGWRGFTSVDVRANEALIAEAVRAGVKRFVYVSVHHVPAMADTPYVRAHEQVVERLKASGLDWCVVRPTGFFSALAVYVDMAKSGAVPSFGDGQTKSNPIADEDLAVVCADACEGSEREIAAGGPDVLTRDQMAETAFAAVGRPVKIRRAPVVVAKVVSWVLCALHPRIGQFVAFLATLAENDLIAPVRGTRRLRAHFDAVARSRP